MSSNYLFSLQPTFTQGLVLGQLSILVLLGLILKYLFLDSTQHPFETSSYHPRVDNKASLTRNAELSRDQANTSLEGTEPAEWFNTLLRQVK